MCSHLGGTNRRLRGLTEIADSRCAMCSVQVRVSGKFQEAGRAVRVPGGGCSNARGAEVRTRSSQSRLDLVRVQVRDGESLPISSCTDDGD